ncbi:MAG: DUF2238 domain-containing protein [Planctomycetaceae bacterium]|nr:DUF2238 domain-containing protein [Planctomycetaceae bacterium]
MSAPRSADSSPPVPSTWPWGVVVFTLAYLSASIVAAVATGNREFVFYIVVMFVLLGAVAAVHRRVHFSSVVLWGLAIWGLAHMAGGMVPVPASWPINGEHRVLYSWWLVPNLLKYDQIVHAYGFGVTTVACWEGLQSMIRGSGHPPLSPSLGNLTLCAAAGMGFGALNEVVEFAATLLVPETNVGGYVNTGWDLVSNMVGTIVAAWGIRFLSGRNSR